VGALLLAVVRWIVGALVGATAVTAGYGQSDASRLMSDGQWDLLRSIIATIASLGCVWAVLTMFQSRSIGTLTSVEGVLRHRWLGWCVGLAVGAVFTGDMLSFVLGRLDGSTMRPFYYWVDGLSTTAMYPTLIIMVLSIPAMAYWPYALWGLVLQTPGVKTAGIWPGIALVTVVSVLAEGALAGGQYGPRDFVSSVMFALTGCAVVVRTGGLEAGIALNLMLWLRYVLKFLGAEQLQMQLLPSRGLYDLGQNAAYLLYAVAAISLARILRIRTVSP
jgi:uncharacterized protein